VSWKEVALALAAFAFALLAIEFVFRMLSPVALGCRYENGVFAVCVALSWLGAVLILLVRPISDAEGATVASRDR